MSKQPQAQKPPLHWLVDEHRLEELCEAVVRYCDAIKPIPDEWLSELHELTGRMHARSITVPRVDPDRPPSPQE
ncbi:MAG: hypothetical protein ACYTEX_28530 [Planctomycetota bacterium]